MKYDFDLAGIASLIKAYRKEHKLTQTELGAMIGWRKSEVCKLERSQKNISISKLTVIFEKLNINNHIEVLY